MSMSGNPVLSALGDIKTAIASCIAVLEAGQATETGGENHLYSTDPIIRTVEYDETIAYVCKQVCKLVIVN